MRFKYNLINVLQSKKNNIMYRKSRFLVGLATAAITFGSLWFGKGSEHFNRGHRPCRPMMEHCCMHEDHFRECDQGEHSKVHEKVIVIKEVTKTDSVKK
jgi:hypothetical protein